MSDAPDCSKITKKALLALKNTKEIA